MVFSNFELSFGLKSAVPVRIRLRSTVGLAGDQPQKVSSRFYSLLPRFMREEAVIKCVCVALHMEFLIVLSRGKRQRG